MNKVFPVLKIIGYAYSMILRELLKKAVDDPTSDYDEVLLEILDKIFDYDAKG